MPRPKEFLAEEALDAREVADFLISSFAGIRIAARGGAHGKHVRSLGKLALRALV